MCIRDRDKKDQGKKKQSKGDNEDMKIDKSKMTQAELLNIFENEKLSLCHFCLLYTSCVGRFAVRFAICSPASLTF